jgi:hypothetical protein
MPTVLCGSTCAIAINLRLDSPWVEGTYCFVYQQCAQNRSTVRITPMTILVQLTLLHEINLDTTTVQCMHDDKYIVTATCHSFLVVAPS